MNKVLANIMYWGWHPTGSIIIFTLICLASVGKVSEEVGVGAFMFSFLWILISGIWLNQFEENEKTKANTEGDKR